MFGAEHVHMARSLGACRALHPEWYDEDGHYIPTIPCCACGRSLPYPAAVLTDCGYAHPRGQCDPADVLVWQARLAPNYA